MTKKIKKHSRALKIFNRMTLEEQLSVLRKLRIKQPPMSDLLPAKKARK